MRFGAKDATTRETDLTPGYEQSVSRRSAGTGSKGGELDQIAKAMQDGVKRAVQSCHEWIVVIQEDGAVTSSRNRGFLLGEGFTKKAFARRPPEGLRGRVDCTARTDGAHPTDIAIPSTKEPHPRAAPSSFIHGPSSSIERFGVQHAMRIVAGGFADYSSGDRASGQHARAREWFAGFDDPASRFLG